MSLKKAILLSAALILLWAHLPGLSKAQATFISDFLVDLNYPAEMEFGPDGDLYVITEQRIIRVSGATGQLLEAFADDEELDQPRALTFGPDGDLYVSSAGNHKVLRFDGTAGYLKGVFAEADTLKYPQGLVFGPDGHLYVASRSQIHRFDGDTGEYLDLFAQGDDLVRFTEVLFGPDGHLYGLSVSGSQILQFDGQTGDFISTFAEGEHTLAFSGLIFGPEGYLYATNRFQNQILRLDGTTGVVIDTLVNSGLTAPHDLLIDDADRLYVSNYESYSIQRYSLEKGEYIDLFSQGSALFNPSDITFGPDGNLYVVSFIGQLLKFDGKTGVYLGRFTNKEEADGIWSLTFGPDNHLYVTSLRNDRVIRYDGRTGEFLAIVVDGIGIDGPRNIAFSPDGSLYVSSAVGNRIVHYETDTGAFIDTPLQVNNVRDITFSPDGLLYAVLPTDNWVAWFDVNRRIFIGAAGQQGNIQGPSHIAFGPHGDLYVSDNDQVLRFDPKTAEFIEVYASIDGLDPAGIAFGPEGDLYIASSQDHKIFRFAGPSDRESNVSTDTETPPLDATLHPAYPNPFTSRTSLQFETALPGRVRLSIYNTYGQLIDVLADGFLAAGSHRFDWQPEGVSSGVYYVRVESTERTSSQKVMYVK